MSPAWVAALAAVGTVLGARLGHELGTLGYRLDEDTPRRARGPFAPWVLAVLTAALWAGLAWRLGGPGRLAVLPAYLFFAVVGVALTWTDLDVHRLPDGLVGPAYPALGALLVTASAATGQWRALLDAVLTGAALVLVYLLLWLPPWGGPGLGDVKLAGLVGLLLGWESPWLAVLATWAAFVLSGLLALGLVATGRAGLKSPIAFGPGMVLGAVLAPVVFQSVRR